MTSDAFTYVKSITELPAPSIFERRNMYLDTETTGLCPLRDRVRLISVSDGNHAWLVDLFHCDAEHVADWLSKCFSSCTRVIGFNFYFDASFLLHRLGVLVPWQKFHCLYSAFRCARNARLPSYSLEHAASQVGVKLDKSEQRSDWSVRELDRKQLLYAAQDVLVLDKICNWLRTEIDCLALGNAYRLDRDMLATLIHRCEPVRIDLNRWKGLIQSWKCSARQCLDNLDKLYCSLVKRSGESTGFLFDDISGVKWTSTKQVTKALRRLGLVVDSTSRRAMSDASRSVSGELVELVKDLRQYRESVKLITAFGQRWIEHGVIAGDEAYMWPLWQVNRAMSGRMSCTEPNLQQVPRGDMRSVFVAPSGYKIVKADYSQIELRVAAWLWQEREMLSIFEKNEVDLHSHTASVVLRKSLSEVTKQDRQLAKAINFGLIYGMSAKTLVSYAALGYGVALSYEEARRIRNWYMSTYRSVARTHRKALDIAESGKGHTLVFPSGRKVWLSPRQATFTRLVNLPVQGSASDGLKRGVALFHNVASSKWRIWAVVHDEVVLLVPEREAEEAKETLVSCMRRGMSEAVKMPESLVLVEAKVLPTWGG